MELVILFLVALGLAMDCFSVGISNSAVSGQVKPGIPLKVALAFALSHVTLVFAGYWLGEALRPGFGERAVWVAFMIFGIIGSKMIMEARKRQPASKVFDINRAKVIVVLSLATAMDAFLAGVAIAFQQLSIHAAGIMIALAVFILSLGGMAGGKQFGIAFAKRTGYFGGAFLLIVAAMILYQLR